MEFTYKLYEGRERKVLWGEKNGAAYSEFETIFDEFNRFVETRILPKGWYAYDSISQTPPIGFKDDPAVYAEPQYLVDRDLTR